MNFITRIKVKILNSSLLRGSIWTILGNGLSRLILVSGSILCANILGAEKYGEFGITRSTINVILVIAGLNVGSVITKYIAEYKDKDIKKCAQMVTQNYLFVLGLTIFLGILLFMFSKKLSVAILNAPNLENEIKLSTIVIIFGILFPLNECIYRGFQWYKRLGVLQVIGSISFLVFVPLGAYYYGVYGAIFGFLIYTLCMLSITTLDLRKILLKNDINLIKFSKELLSFKELNKLTVPVLLSSLVEAPFFWIAQISLISFAGMVDNGILSAILQIRNLVLIIPGYVSLVALPHLTQSYLNPNANYRYDLKNIAKLNLLFSIVCILPLLFFPNLILRFFGHDFILNSNYWDSFFAYISIPFLVISNVLNQGLLAKNRGWANLKISIIWNVTFVVINYVLLKYYNLGVTAFTVSFFFAIIVQTILRYIYERD